MLRSNFLRILRTPLGRVATDYGPSAVRPEGDFAPKVAADPKALFLNHKSPSQRAKEEGVFCDPLHGSVDSVVVAYCVEVWGGHCPWLRWRVETKGMPATLVAMGQWIEEGDREQVRV